MIHPLTTQRRATTRTPAMPAPDDWPPLLPSLSPDCPPKAVGTARTPLHQPDLARLQIAHVPFARQGRRIRWLSRVAATQIAFHVIQDAGRGVAQQGGCL